METEANQPKEPPITEPKKLADYHIQNDLPHLKRGWRGFVAALVIAVSISFSVGFGLAWKFVVTSKDATIQTLQTSLNESRAKADGLQKDNDRLTKQNADFRQTIAEQTTPLKSRAKILSEQLAGISKRFDHNNQGTWYDLQNEYQSRFEYRVNTLVRQLDELGQNSDALNKASGTLR